MLVLDLLCAYALLIVAPEQYDSDYTFSFLVCVQNWPDLKPVVFFEMHGCMDYNCNVSASVSCS